MVPYLGFLAPDRFPDLVERISFNTGHGESVVQGVRLSGVDLAGTLAVVCENLGLHCSPHLESELRGKDNVFAVTFERIAGRAFGVEGERHRETAVRRCESLCLYNGGFRGAGCKRQTGENVYQVA